MRSNVEHLSRLALSLIQLRYHRNFRLSGHVRAKRETIGGNMRRPWLLFLLCLLFLTSLTTLTRASLTVRVDDSAIRIVFDDHGTRVLLPLETSQPLTTNVHIELLNTDGATAVQIEHEYQLRPGRNELTIPIGSWISGKSEDTREFLWYRLRYQITPAATSQFDKVSNIISLSQITPDIFALNVMAPREVHEGAAYRL